MNHRSSAARRTASRGPAAKRAEEPWSGRQGSFAIICRADIVKAFELLGHVYPPVLTLKQAAALAQLAPATLKRRVSEGGFKRSVKRGKPLRFFRDTFVQELMNS